jgi:hypothetical protein
LDRDFTFNQEAQDRAQSAGYKSQLSHPLLSPYLLTGTALTEETTPFTQGPLEMCPNLDRGQAVDELPLK